MPWDFVAILLALGVIVPLRGRVKMRNLLALSQISSLERLSLYASTIAFQWVFAGVAAWRAWAHGLRAADLGITISDPRRIGIAAAAGAILFSALQWVNLRRMSRIRPASRGTLPRLAQLILPRTDVEKLVYFALAVTAGVCEEFLYRGFAMAAFTRAGLPAWAAIGVTAALFGLAHLYQGRSGVVATLTFGIVFGAARIAYDSLVPVVIWHATVDLLGGMLGGRYLLRSASEPSS
jgi:membrane protease YdiL (CAAX protease family)